MAEDAREKLLDSLRLGLEARGVQSAWGKLRLVAFDREGLSVTLEPETANYLFEHRFKTTRPVIALSELLERGWFTPALEERKLLEALVRPEAG